MLGFRRNTGHTVLNASPEPTDVNSRKESEIRLGAVDEEGIILRTTSDEPESFIGTISSPGAASRSFYSVKNSGFEAGEGLHWDLRHCFGRQVPPPEVHRSLGVVVAALRRK